MPLCLSLKIVYFVVFLFNVDFIPQVLSLMQCSLNEIMSIRGNSCHGCTVTDSFDIARYFGFEVASMTRKCGSGEGFA